MKTVEKILLKFNPENTNLLPALKEISAAFGYVAETDMQRIAEYFRMPLSKVYETASFYDQINIIKQPSLVIKICLGTNCTVNNSFDVIREIENYFRIKTGDESLAYRQAGNSKIKLESISCMGRCGEGPVIVINNQIYTQVTQSSIHSILEKWL